MNRERLEVEKEKWEIVKLGELLVSQPKSKIKASQGLLFGEFNFFTSSNIQNKYLDEYMYDEEALIFGTGGNASVHFCDSPFATSTDCIVCYKKSSTTLLKYIYLVLKGNIYLLQNGFKGAGLQHVSKDYIFNIEIPLPPIEIQKQIADELDKITGLIEKRKQQIEKIDLLVKAKFVEMFGDPVANPMGWEEEKLDSIAVIKIGPFGSLLHKEDYVLNEHALVNPAHIIDGKIITDNNLTINSEKYEELKSYHLQIGDVIMGRRGEMGRCAVVKEERLLCGTGSIRLRCNPKMLPSMLQNIISFPTYKKNIEDNTVGVTMQNLNVSIVSRFNIPVPPIKLQNQFAQYVEEIEKLKIKFQQSLEQLEILYKQRIQEYFQ